MGTSPLTFTGLSKFSDSFQVVLERSFTVANLPVKNLETDRAQVENQQAALGLLAGDLRGLQDVAANLGLLLASGAVNASSSDSSVATVPVTGNPERLSFDLNVTSAATTAQESSAASVAAIDSGGLSADGAYKLTVGSSVQSFDLDVVGSGRTAGTTGAATPSPKPTVEVQFSNGLSGSVTAELDSFFVAAAGPSGAAAGDSVSVTFTSSDGSIQQTIQTAALAGGEDAAAVASALNDAIAANAELNGKVSFSDEGGALKLVVSDTAGTGFGFTSSSTGSIVSGLESGGAVGGQSAEEIAAALNAQVALNSELTAAGVRFEAADGEVRIAGDVAFDATVTDQDQGTGFASGLAGAHSITGHDNTLAGLRDHINAQSASLGIKASIINTSSNASAPAYRLTLTATETGAKTLKLADGLDADLLTTSNQGSDAVFEVDGLTITNSSNTIVDFAPGVTLTIVGEGSAKVSASDNKSGVSSQLSKFADAYNAVVARLNAHIGEDAGVLSGHAMIREAQATLRSITGFLGEGGVRAMAAVGLTLDDQGQMSFGASTFSSASTSDFAAVKNFLGDTTKGFIGNAFSRLKGIADPVSGQVQTALKFLQESHTRLASQITAAEERVDAMMLRLEEQFAVADRLLSQLESQQDMLTQLFKAQDSSKD